MTATRPPATSSAPSGALRRLAAASAWTLGGSVIAAAAGFALTAVVTQGLSKDDAGRAFTLVALALVLQSAFSYGAGAGLVRFVPRFEALQRAGEVRRLIAVAVAPVACFATLGSVLTWVLAPHVASWIGSPGNSEVEQSVRVVAVSLLVNVAEVVAAELCRALGRLRIYVAVHQVLVPVGRMAAVTAAVGTGGRLPVVLAAWAAPLAVGTAVAVAVAGRELGAPRFTNGPVDEDSTGSLAREYWAFTVPRGLAAVLDILLTWLDVILVAALLSPVDAAIYAAASRFITSGTLAMQALRLANATHLSRALATEDRQLAGSLYRAATTWTVLASWPIYLMLAIFGPAVLSIFGPGYSRGATALAVLSLGMLVVVCFGNVGATLLLAGRSSWVLADKVGAVALNVVVNLVLIPRLGLLGAAIAWTLTLITDATVAFLQVRLGLRLPSLGRLVVTAAAVMGVAFGVVPFAVRLVAGASWGSAIVAGLLGLVVAVALAAPVRRALLPQRTG